ncbi:choline-binding transcriptional repressor BetI [Jhaorihella thermophila]|uniref:HTH-type transcriptional regulator BetI n=1 Tax=Jhaorihella thermophila TaxID=488547 RepID=A0A1H5YFV1_9RHOB|nr:transcriptional regulator BetI [Jhaorihella thermophila]SEG22487.1 TetR/AcrR family transcriptional regulator, transcriptional repressor of bet genes [Jhaorihella thermophila]
MPKLGMEPIRREALVKATIAEIGAAGSLDVTVSQIARRAGMSSALAHHYFGGKEQIFLAAMRRILTDFGEEARRELKAAAPDRRAEAIIRASFAPSSFTRAAVSAWMSFYVLAQTNDAALKLWRIYQARLNSNLTHALRGRVADPRAAAETLVALIDGIYIRAALHAPEAPEAALDHAMRVLEMLKAAG